jgi:REP element-mobilizing transposase RayT
VPGGVYHVVSRGNERQDVFLDDGDRSRYLSTLRSITERLNIHCHTYCLMGNHYHLLLETPDANLSFAIRQLNGVYAQSFNRRHGRVGHLFQGRFTSRLVEKDSYLLVVSRYIVLNPVRAGLVPRPADWTWSSYRAHAGCVEPPPFLTVDWLLAHFDTTDRRKAQEAYREFVQEGLNHPKPVLDDRPILGRESFVASFRENLRHAAPLKDVPRVQRFAARPPLLRIFRACEGRRDRNARIREAHDVHGYTMTEIASHLRLHLMTISRVVRGC